MRPCRPGTLALLALAAVAGLAAVACGSAMGPAAFPPQLEPVRQLHQERGGLAWDGLPLGITLREVERLVGRALPVPTPAGAGSSCGRPGVEVEVEGTRLRLELSGTDDASRVLAMWVLLARRGQTLEPASLERAVRARLPDLRRAPPGSSQRHPAGTVPGLLYELAGGNRVLLDPRRGVYFGDLCLTGS